MMTTVRIIDEPLRVELTGWDRIWALKREIEVPLVHVRGVAFATPDLRPRGLRAPGSYWPGLIAAGTYRRRSGKEFWSVRDKAQAIVIDLENDVYDRLVLQVADRAATVEAIRGAAGLASSPS